MNEKSKARMRLKRLRAEIRTGVREAIGDDPESTHIIKVGAHIKRLVRERDRWREKHDERVGHEERLQSRVYFLEDQIDHLRARLARASEKLKAVKGVAKPIRSNIRIASAKKRRQQNK